MALFMGLEGIWLFKSPSSIEMREEGFVTSILIRTQGTVEEGCMAAY